MLFHFLFFLYLPYNIIQRQTNRCEKLKKETNFQACCYTIFNVLHNTIHHFENSVIYINSEIYCMFNIMICGLIFPHSFSFLLGTC